MPAAALGEVVRDDLLRSTNQSEKESFQTFQDGGAMMAPAAPRRQRGGYSLDIPSSVTCWSIE